MRIIMLGTFLTYLFLSFTIVDSYMVVVISSPVRYTATLDICFVSDCLVWFVGVGVKEARISVIAEHVILAMIANEFIIQILRFKSFLVVMLVHATARSAM
jgi:hypothetical protein